MEFPVANEELGEVLFEWGDRREIVALEMLESEQLDVAMLKEDPMGGGIAGLLSRGSFSYSIEMCGVIIKAAFTSCQKSISGEELLALRKEIGFNEYKDKAGQLLMYVLLGQKKMMLYLEARKQEIEEMMKKRTPSPGDATAASPLASSDSQPENTTASDQPNSLQPSMNG